MADLHYRRQVINMFYKSCRQPWETFFYFSLMVSMFEKITISLVSATRELCLRRKTFTFPVLNVAVIVNVASSKLKFVVTKRRKSKKFGVCGYFRYLNLTVEAESPYNQREVRKVSFLRFGAFSPDFAFLELVSTLERYPTDYLSVFGVSSNSQIPVVNTEWSYLF